MPGAGRVIRGGIVTWHDSSKETCLRVDPSIMSRHGAVSPAVAREMAHGAKRALGADIGLAITGVEGRPKDGHPPGLTFLALATADGRTLLRRYSHDHGSGRNRERDVRMALGLIQEALQGEPPR